MLKLVNSFPSRMFYYIIIYSGGQGVANRTCHHCDIPTSHNYSSHKVRHLSGSAFCLVGVGVSGQVLGWFPLGFVENDLFELS